MAEWLIGRGPECDIVVADEQVSGRHCRLEYLAGQFRLTDLGSTNGTLVNGAPVRETVVVKRSDEVLLAGVAALPWPAEPGRAAATVVGHEAAVRVVSLGRDPASDIVVEGSDISWNHARIEVRGGRGVIFDVGSSNGVFVGRPDRRVVEGELRPQDPVWLGSVRVDVGAAFAGDDRASGVGAPAPNRESELILKQVAVDPERGTLFGRDPECDQVLDHPMVSWRHARIRRVGDGFEVEDLASTNGTFVNGVRVEGTVVADADDLIVLGAFAISLSSDGELVTRDERGVLSIEARDVAVTVPGKVLLKGVSFTIEAGEFVGLMGPSGAGKSTLMNALNGYTRPSEGQVFIGRRDLYAEYDAFRGLVGYVPQDDIMHGELTVGQALFYTARLRLPADFSATEIRARIQQTLALLGLQGTEDVLIGSPDTKGISGGQRKRVNLAMELLTDPAVLFLDEPTSGLSSEDALTVMRVLRDLASDGKTILLTIHQPSLEAFRLMDHLALVGKDQGSTAPGQLAYFGPAYPDAVRFFNPEGIDGLAPTADPSPDEVLRGFSQRPTADWVRRYRRSLYCNTFVKRRRRRESAPVRRPGRRRMEGSWRQTLALFQRTATIKVRDRANTALLLVQAPVIAALIAIVFGRDARAEVSIETWSAVQRATGTSLFLLALAALWCGCSNAVRELVAERAIYRRERMVNLAIPSYLASKLGVLMGLSTVQCLTLIAIVHATNGLSGPWLSLFLVLLLSSGVGVALGLAISAVAKTSEFAVAMLPIAILPMVMFGGVLQPLHDMSPPVEWLSRAAPTRWCFEGLMLLEARERPLLPVAEGALTPAVRLDGSAGIDMAEPLFRTGEHRTSVSTAAAVPIAMGVGFIAIAGLALRRRDRH